MNSGDVTNEEIMLIKEIELIMENLKNSTLYAGLRSNLKKEKFQKHLSRLLGSYSDVEVVIFCLGSIEFNFDSLFQLAVLLQLKRDFPDWIGDIKIYDPVMSAVDIGVFMKLDLQVLTIDDNCKRKAERPTMFYMPNPHYDLIGNLLGANWSSSCLNQIVVLTNSLHVMYPHLPLSNKNDLETMLRLHIIRKFTIEIDINPAEAEMQYGGFFKEFTWHFFDVDTDIDKPGWCWLDIQRYPELVGMIRDHTDERCTYIFSGSRLPRYFRGNSVLPPPNWIKLSIYGISAKGDLLGQFGGVIQNDTGRILRRYRGDIDVDDNVIAGLCALKHGLDRCMEIKPKPEMLFVESDIFMLVQYVNQRAEPDKKTASEMNKALQADIGIAIYHVYEQANKNASHLVLRDASERKLNEENLQPNMTELQLGQVSSVNEHVGEQDAAGKTADFDVGDGLVAD